MKEYQHKKFDELLANLEMKLDVYIHGPTGSSKTHSIFNASKKLGLPFYKKVVGSSMSESSILGYMLGKDYIPGIAYEPFVNGGVMLFDEVDNGNSNTNLILNGLSDGQLAFPCGMRERHKDFVLISTANTLGNGPNLTYVGRNRQDAALLNRFVFIFWPYDVELTYGIALNEVEQKFPDENSDAYWEVITKLNNIFVDVEKMTQVIEELKLQHIISPRTMKQVSIKTAWNRPLSEILNTVLLKGLTKEQKQKILDAIRNKESKLENLPKFKKRSQVGSDNDNNAKDKNDKSAENNPQNETSKPNELGKTYKDAYTKAMAVYPTFEPNKSILDKIEGVNIIQASNTNTDTE